MGTLAVNGERVCVPSEVHPSTRLVDFIRTRTRFRGPKLACGEGGCGACVVLCDRYNPLTGEVSSCTLNSCLATVGALDGCSITTSEGLGNSKAGFHPVQDALARNFASQCGFCTPGITVAVAAAAAAAGPGLHGQGCGVKGVQGDSPSAVSLAHGVDGNLCRCTGWRPIIDACRDVAVDMEDLSSSKPGCCKKGGGGGGKCSSSCSTPQFPEWLKQYVAAKHQQQQVLAASTCPVSSPHPFTGLMQHSGMAAAAAGQQTWLAPTSLQQLAALLKSHGGAARFVAGNTGSGVYKELWPHDAPVVITPHSVPEMTAVSHQAHGVILGGAVTIQQLLQVLRAPAAACAAACSAAQGSGQACSAAVAGCGAAAGGRTSCGTTGSSSSGSGKGEAPASTAVAWGAMADHLERIAGVHVRSAATLGGHFGLCAIRSLPTDLGLVLAAAGAQLQVLTVHHHASSSHHPQQQQQHWQQQQQQWQWQQYPAQHLQQESEALDLEWMSAEAFLADSAVGGNERTAAGHSAAAAADTGGHNASSSVAELITADAVAGANVLCATEQQQQQQQQAADPPTAATPACSSSSSNSCIRVVTAVWLPYADDGCERFWSYKLSWRHVNSHAFANMAVWMKFDTSSSSSSSAPGKGQPTSSTCMHTDLNNSSSSSMAAALAAQVESKFAGAAVSSVRLFVGCPPNSSGPAAAEGPAAAAGSAAPPADVELWRVMRATATEQTLKGSSVSVQGLIAALRQLGQELQQEMGATHDSFHSQALQGMLFKALVPLLDPEAITQQDPPQQQQQQLVQATSSSSSSRQDAGNAELLRLLQLPATYDPKVLPQGRQVLPAPPGLQDSQQHTAPTQHHHHQQQQQPDSRSDSSQQKQQQQQQEEEEEEEQRVPGTAAMQAQVSPDPQPHLIRCHPTAPHSTSSVRQCSADTTANSSSTRLDVSGAAATVGEVERAGAAGALPLHLPVEKDAVRLQASGEAEYTGDVAARMGERVLYLAGVRSSRALAALVCVDASAALALPGVTACLTARDIPAGGSNSVFGAPLLAEGKVEYVGQLIALVAATSQLAADRAAKLVCVTYQDLPGQTPIITLDQAIAADSFYSDAAALRAEAVQHTALQTTASPPKASADAAATGHCLSPDACDASNQCSRPAQEGGSGTLPDAPAGPDSSSQVVRVADLIAASPLRLSGQYSLPAQQHMYMETQTAVAEASEDGCVRVWSATQSLDAVQQAVAGVLGVSFNQVAVITRRLGGGFGGKASRSMPVAAAAALAATLLQRPVCYSLNRNEDFAANAGRCAGRVEYAAGFTPEGKIVAIQAQVIFRAGAYLDLAMNDGGTLVAASDSAYDLSGLSVEVKMARCNLPPHTIMRGPGYLQGCMFMEQILEHVAAVLGKDSAEVKAANFLPEVHRATRPITSSSSGGSSRLSDSSISSSATQGQLSSAGSDTSSSSAAASSSLSPEGSLQDQEPLAVQQQLLALALKQVPEASRDDDCLDHTGSSEPDLGQPAAAGVVTALGRFIAAESYTLPRLWRELLRTSRYSERVEAVQQHNSSHAWSKRGIVVTPVRFDCAPAAVSASLSVYADGSVLVNHGGIEMGQGLATKVKQAAVAALSELLPAGQRPLPLDLVRLSPSSSCINPNGGPTWSSTGSEGNCQAVMNAAADIVSRLRPGLKVGKDALSTWQATIAAQFSDVGFAPSGVMLSAYGYFDGTVAAQDSMAGSGGRQSTSSTLSRAASGGSSGRQAVQYSAFGAAVTEVELDMLTGERRVLATDIAYDCGYSLNPRIDLGQVEGAFVMGLGAMLCEEVVVDDATGSLKSDSTWTYKIPTPDLIPQQFTVSFLSDAPNPAGIAGSKASGEPALMTSTSALLALQQAVAAAAAELEKQQKQGRGCGGGRHPSGWRVLAAPATPQRIKGVMGPVSIADALEAAMSPS